MRAQDAANNLSAYSNTASATTPAAPDATPPTAPGSLGATPVSATQVNLSWTAATDNVGVTQYLVERCSGAGCSSFAQIATAAAGATGYSDSSALASTAYSYRVRAQDAANNLSAYSNTASATTPAPPDSQPPSAPGPLSASAVSASQIDLAWGAATDDVGIGQYRIERCSGPSCANFQEIATTTGTTYPDTGLSASTSYTYRVRAEDTSGNRGLYTNLAAATTRGPRSRSPSRS